MSVFHQLTDEEILAEFTHVGWFAGLVPVYFADIDGEGCVLQERNWCPEWWFTFVERVFGLFCQVACLLNPDFEPSFPITLTGEIVRLEADER